MPSLHQICFPNRNPKKREDTFCRVRYGVWHKKGMNYPQTQEDKCFYRKGMSRMKKKNSWKGWSPMIYLANSLNRKASGVFNQLTAQVCGKTTNLRWLWQARASCFIELYQGNNFFFPGENSFACRQECCRGRLAGHDELRGRVREMGIRRIFRPATMTWSAHWNCEGDTRFSFFNMNGLSR